jgi:hypothetical protein
VLLLPHRIASRAWAESFAAVYSAGGAGAHYCAVETAEPPDEVTHGVTRMALQVMNFVHAAHGRRLLGLALEWVQGKDGLLTLVGPLGLHWEGEAVPSWVRLRKLSRDSALLCSIVAQMACAAAPSPQLARSFARQRAVVRLRALPESAPSASVLANARWSARTHEHSRDGVGTAASDLVADAADEARGLARSDASAIDARGLADCSIAHTTHGRVADLVSLLVAAQYSRPAAAGGAVAVPISERR